MQIPKMPLSHPKDVITQSYRVPRKVLKSFSGTHFSYLFRNVIEKATKENLQADKYLLPYATVELALLLIETSGTAADEAWHLLETAM